MKIRALIVDDEALARRGISKRLEAFTDEFSAILSRHLDSQDTDDEITTKAA